MSRVLETLSSLGIELPQAPKPVASYVPAVRCGDLLFISGQVPFVEGELAFSGPVPSKLSPDQAQEAARICAINALAVAHETLELGLDQIERVVRLGVFVLSDPGFGGQPQVANGASDLMVEIFGEAGRHARAAVGSVGLPLSATVEIEMVLQIRS
ncbi:MAG: RidA family protein [Phycisphaerales bacterium]|nr:RidA family protein [Phycisphaerales bacterium]